MDASTESVGGCTVVVAWQQEVDGDSLAVLHIAVDEVVGCRRCLVQILTQLHLGLCNSVADGADKFIRVLQVFARLHVSCCLIVEFPGCLQTACCHVRLIHNRKLQFLGLNGDSEIFFILCHDEKFNGKKNVSYVALPTQLLLNRRSGA